MTGTDARQAGGDAGRFRIASLPVISWALYDFANTIFSFAITSAYFNTWVVDDARGLGGQDIHLALMDVGMTLGLIATMPVFGAIADAYGRRKPFLVAFTLLSVAATVALAFLPNTHAMLLPALLLGGVAIFGFQSAISHYDPLLADVAPPAWRGRVSGIGVGTGYIGVLFALVVLTMIVHGAVHDQRAFLPTAVMFLAFALPCFLFVRERPRAPREGQSLTGIVRASVRGFGAGFVHVARRPDVVRFLCGRFLYVDALAVIIQFFKVYMDRLDFGSDAIQNAVLGIAILSAAIGAMVAGRLVEWRGPRWVLLRVLTLVVVSLLATGATGSPYFIWVLAPAIGIGLGSVWTSDRVFMLRMSPPASRGEFFGVYNLIGKVGGAVGPMLWGTTVYVAHHQLGWSLLDASRLAIVVIAVPALVGLLIIRPLSDGEREWEPHELDPAEQEVAA